jgi:hypothetical protein
MRWTGGMGHRRAIMAGVLSSDAFFTAVLQFEMCAAGRLEGCLFEKGGLGRCVWLGKGNDTE